MKMLLKLTFAYWISKIMTNVLMGKGCINKEKKKKEKKKVMLLYLWQKSFLLFRQVRGGTDSKKKTGIQ